MAEIINNATVDTGAKVSFTVINTLDPVLVKTGVVVGFVNYDLASMISDINNYQNQVLKDHGGSPDIRNQKFIVISVKSEDSVAEQKYAYALSWIVPTSFNIVGLTRAVDFRVYGISDDKIVVVLQLLTEAGFRVKLTPT